MTRLQSQTHASQRPRRDAQSLLGTTVDLPTHRVTEGHSRGKGECPAYLLAVGHLAEREPCRARDHRASRQRFRGAGAVPASERIGARTSNSLERSTTPQTLRLTLVTSSRSSRSVIRRKRNCVRNRSKRISAATRYPRFCASLSPGLGWTHGIVKREVGWSLKSNPVQ